MPTPLSLRTDLLAQASWVNPEATADVIEHGDPDRELHRIGTGWSSCLANLEAAAEDGCDLFICHEPTFYDFWDPNSGFRETAWGRKRIALLDEAGMALMSLHDTWDFFPRWGIRDSWMEYLGLTDLITSMPYEDRPNEGAGAQNSLSLLRIPATTLEDYARELAARIKPLRCGGVTVQGNLAATVVSVAVGLGCHIPTFEMFDQGADVLVQVYDRALQSTTRNHLGDLGANIITIEHAAAEIPGMENLARYLEQEYGLPSTCYANEPESIVISGE
ncbi:MAG: Nif3-like dinuclear metal center hexameric protein [Planctomycetota bacterium]|jgi:putative NIF3 family GTP cyclohydrolase 1 type 2